MNSLALFLHQDCQARKLNKEDAMDHSRRKKLVKDVWWSLIKDGYEMVNVSSGTDTSG